MSQPIYLAKSGRVFGPYSQEEYDSLESTGALAKFTWIWDSKKESWQALDPAPAPLKLEPMPMEETKGAVVTSLNSIQAICHDQRRAMAGILRKVTDSGCELVSHDESAAVHFAQTGQILLNLLNIKTGRSIDIAAQLASVSRRGKAWNYQILWNTCPDVVLERA